MYFHGGVGLPESPMIHHESVSLLSQDDINLLLYLIHLSAIFKFTGHKIKSDIQYVL